VGHPKQNYFEATPHSFVFDKTRRGGSPRHSFPLKQKGILARENKGFDMKKIGIFVIAITLICYVGLNGAEKNKSLPKTEVEKNLFLGFFWSSAPESTVQLDLEDMRKCKAVPSDKLEEVFKKNGGDVKESFESSNVVSVKVTTDSLKGIVSEPYLKMGENFTVVVGSHVYLAQSKEFLISCDLMCNPNWLLEMILKVKHGENLPKYDRLPCIAIKGDLTEKLKPVLYEPAKFDDKESLEFIKGYIQKEEEKIPKFKKQFADGENKNVQLKYFFCGEDKNCIFVSYQRYSLDNNSSKITGLVKYFPINKTVEIIVPIKIRDIDNKLGCVSNDQDFILELDIDNDLSKEYIIPAGYLQGRIVVLLKKENEKGYNIFLTSAYYGL
jgi:hypothetical protein